MASIIQLVNYFKADTKEFESLLHDLIVNSNDVPFDSEEVDALQSTIVTSINSRLSHANTRYNGLLILDRILDECPKDVFLKYGLLWIAKATQVLENVHSNVRDLTLACKVLGSLIERCKEIPELNKQISIHSVKQLVNALNALRTDAKCGAAYYLLAVLLYHYPEVCEKFQVSIGKTILSQIDSAEENLVNASARCYVLLSKAVERSFKPPPERSVYNSWMYDEALLCNTLHAIMDTLFSELIELESVDIWDRLELPSISENNIVEYYNTHRQRFANLCTYLSTMLSGYQAQNSVFPDDILKVLCRGLAIVPLKLKNTSFREQMLYIILPKLHISLLSVLDAFINGFAQELIPFGAKILQLLQQTLQWTSTVLDNEITIGRAKPFKSVRVSAYKCLSSWLTNTGSLSGVETIANECIVYILKDTIPERDRVLLTVQQKTQHLSKRAMKRFKESQYENSPILNNEAAPTKNLSLDKELCKQALVALQNIFSNGVLLKQTLYKNVQNSVIPLLHDLYLGSCEQNFYKAHNECRLQLFKVLKALQMNPHITLAFPTQYCLTISHAAAYDVDLDVAREAKLALAELEKIIHPAAPTLQLPRQQKPDESVAENEVEEIASPSKLDKRSRTEEESPADVISSILKRSRLTVECTEAVQLEQPEDNAESIETSDMDAEKSQAKLHELVRTPIAEQKTGNALREREETHTDEENRSRVDEIMDVADESEAEGELIRHVGEEEKEQDERPEDLPARTDQVDKIAQGSPDVAKEEAKSSENIVEDEEERMARNYQMMFNDDVTLSD